MSGRRDRVRPKLQSMSPAHAPNWKMIGLPCRLARTSISQSLAPDILCFVVVRQGRLSDRVGIATRYTTNDKSLSSRRIKTRHKESAKQRPVLVGGTKRGHI